MKIGIDARLYTETGIGRYISNLINQLEKLDAENEYIIFVTEEGSKSYHPESKNFKKWVADYKAYSIDEQLKFPLELMRARLDLLHVPHFNAPIFYPRKFMVTIHDLTMHEFSSKNDSTLPQWQLLVKQILYRLVTGLTGLRSTKIFVPTETVKDEIQKKLFGANPSKIVVTSEGVDDKLLKLAPSDEGVLRTRLEEMNIRGKYFLYVGNAYPHKNLQSLVIGFKNFLQKYDANTQLIIAGKIDVFSERLAAFVHGLKLDGNIIFAARYSEEMRVPDKDLAYLYKGALAYVSPSLKEGFSITPLEAQAFGVPVILSDIPTHKEVFGDSVSYFDPQSTTEITQKLYEVALSQDLRDQLAYKGGENLKKYSWEEMAKTTLRIYNGQ